eukprot:4619700-Pyramimonas_sp.AAC.1
MPHPWTSSLFWGSAEWRKPLESSHKMNAATIGPYHRFRLSSGLRPSSALLDCNIGLRTTVDVTYHAICQSPEAMLATVNTNNCQR